MKKIKFFDAFSGVGGFRIAFEREGYECVGWSEIDKFAIKLYKEYFKDNNNYGDITKINPKELPDFEIITAGLPCFPPETEVFTSEGFKKIIDVKVGDKVLSHDGKFHKVIETTERHYEGELIEIHPRYGIPPIKCTPEHPILIAERKRKWNNKKRRYEYYWEEKWKNASEITKDDFLVIIPHIPKNYIRKPEFENIVKVNQYKYKTETLPLDNPDFWYLVGFYIADGYTYKSKKPNGRYKHIVVWTCNIKEYKRIAKKIKKVFGRVTYSRDKNNPNTVKLIVGSVTLYKFLEQFGKYAHGKYIPNFMYFLPKHLKLAFLKGYFDGDGYREHKNCLRAITVSKELAIGIQRLLTTLDGVVPSLSKQTRKPKHIIQGRIVNQRDTYRICWNTNKRKTQFIKDNKLYIRIKDIKKVQYKGEVYNLEVEETHTYTVGNFIVVHNCQPYSVAGKRKGLEDPRGMPLWKSFFRIIEHKKPKIILIENVKGILSTNRGRDFAWILTQMAQLGYTVEWQVLNSKNFGVPQNRERVYIIGYLGGDGRPKIFPLRENQKTYYQPPNRKPQIQTIPNTSNTIRAGYYKIGNEGPYIVQWRRNYLRIPKDQTKTPTLTANMGTGGLNMPLLIYPIKKGKINIIGNIYPSGGSAGNIIIDKSISPTLTTGNGGARVPIILKTENGNNEYVIIDLNDLPIRKITPLEAFRLQGFPDDIVKLAKEIGISDTQLYKMAGNAITVPVAQSIARAIKETFFE